MDFEVSYLGQPVTLTWDRTVPHRAFVDLMQARQFLDALLALEHQRTILRAMARASPRWLGETRDDGELIEALARMLLEGHLVARGAGDGGLGGQPLPPSPPSPPSLPVPPSQPPAPGQPTQQPFALVSLDYPQVIAPGAEDPKPLIRWTIVDPDVQITRGELELLRSGSQTPVFRRSLRAGELAHGDHELAWDGEIGQSLLFPQGHVSVEFPPYELRLTVFGAGREETKSTSFAVVAVSLEVAVGQPEWVSGDKNQDVVREMQRLIQDEIPAGDDLPVPLRSNVFFANELHHLFGQGTFEGYKSLWQEGPTIPLIADLKFESSQGEAVLAPKAWGRRRILWDVELLDHNPQISAGAAKRFVQQAADYRAAGTAPPGRHSHLHRGGKRNAPSSTPYFAPFGSSFSFPFEVARQRAAAALTHPAQSGEHEGRSGVIFKPARQAGDDYRVHLFFHSKRSVDTPTPSGELQTKTPKHLVRRQINVHLMKKRESTEELPRATLASAQQFRDVSLALDLSPSYTVADRAQWLASLEKNRKEFGDLFEFLDPDVNQYDDADWGLTWMSLEKTAEVLLQKMQAQVRDEGLSDEAPGFAALAESVLRAAQFTMTPDEAEVMGINGRRTFSLILLDRITRDLMPDKPGITLFIYNDVTNHDRRRVEILGREFPNGITQQSAPDRARCTVCANHLGTAVHEMGHALGMPHAPGGAETPELINRFMHDEDDPHCAMNYELTANSFCGLCNLRIRGWDATRLSSDGSKNTQP